MMTNQPKTTIRSATASLLLFCGVQWAGCAPALDPKQYGEVVTELPKVAGVEKPFPLPKLENPPDDPQKADDESQK